MEYSLLRSCPSPSFAPATYSPFSNSLRLLVLPFAVSFKELVPAPCFPTQSRGHMPLAADRRRQRCSADIFAYQSQEPRSYDQHDAYNHRQIDPVAEQNIAEQNRPDHLTILRRADIRCRSLTYSPHRQHVGYGGEQPVGGQFRPLIPIGRREAPKGQQTANNDSTKDSRPEQREILFLTSGSSKGHYGDSSSKTGKQSSKMSDRKRAEPRP